MKNNYVIAVLLLLSPVFGGCTAMGAKWIGGKLGNSEQSTTVITPNKQVIREVCPASKVTHSCYVGYDASPINFPASIEPSKEDPNVPFWEFFYERIQGYVEAGDPIPVTDWETLWYLFAGDLNVRMDLYEKLYIREVCIHGIVQSSWDAYNECKAQE